MAQNGDDEILAETLRETSAIRMAIGRKHRWFCHITPFGNADSIRKTGLLPNADARPPEPVIEAFGPASSRIICVSPFGVDIVPPAVQEGPFICLAFRNEALPIRIGLDWSYDGAVGLARVLREERPTAPIGEIFVEAVRRRGSMVLYDPVEPSALRVFTKSCPPHNPERWPTLTEADNSALGQFL